MNSYAIFGATGNTGTALIKNLLRDPNAQIHAFCRSQSKLNRLLPETADNSKVTVFEGSINDIDLLSSCVRGCRAVFLCVATNTNLPGCSLALDTAQSAVKALEKNRQAHPSQRVPKIVMLSSVTEDPHMCRNVPPLVLWFIKRAESNVYADLSRAREFLCTKEDWLTSIFVMPGAISPDEQRGHALTFDGEDKPISYLDLAAGMIEAADDPTGRYDMRNVGVANTNGSAAFTFEAVVNLTTGFVRHYLPFLHPYLP